MSDHLSESAESTPRNFIRTVIDEDLEQGKHQQVVTRFPPEPNGYLHIGHAKSICLNFGLALDYGGRCHLRYDDTNPLKESQEYVDAIQRDVAWLGFDWGEHLYFASDYFGAMYGYAVELIEQGLAYVDSQPLEVIRAQRGALTERGVQSADRDRSVSENLDLFARMRAGEFADGTHVLRAKIDMGASNMLMRDPVLYRIRHAHHHRTGDAWCIYPMYDFAHCIEDALEGVTHSICTLEFENNRELYDWLLDHISVPARPRQYEFARLNLDYTVMSKRKLLRLVEEGHVSGWDDPRMPTIAGLRRRGVTPEAIRAFADMIGVAKANSVVDYAKLEFCIRDDLNTRAPRVMAVLDPLKVVIRNYPEDQVEQMEVPYWPHDVPKEGSRQVPFTRELWIEREDFMETPTKGFFRLAPGSEVRLRYGYYITCEEVVRDAAGEVVELRCVYDPASRGGSTPDNRKVKGTIHWVSATHNLEATVRLYDHLFHAARPDGGEEDLGSQLRADSAQEVRAYVERSLAELAPGEHVQFERQGYFFVDPVDSTTGAPVFHRVVSLKDSWAKQASDTTPLEATPPATTGVESDDEDERRKRPTRRTRTEERAIGRERNPALAERYARFIHELGLSEEEADVLTGELALADFFEATLAHPGASREGVINWVSNELLRELKDTSLEALPFDPTQLGALVALSESGTLTSRAARDVFAIMLKEGGEPESIVARLGLTQIEDPEAIGAIIAQVIERNAAQAAQYRAGKTQLLGFFVGQVMQLSRGKAEPTLTRELLTRALDT